MADYYSILEKTISGLPNNTPEVRNVVFKKAKTAIETQLQNMDPLPSEEAISAQLRLLDEAILLINSEYGVLPEISAEPLPVDVIQPAEVVAASQPEVPAEVVAVETTAPSDPVDLSVVERTEAVINSVQPEIPPSVGLDMPSAVEQTSNSGSVAVDLGTVSAPDATISPQVNNPGSTDMSFEEKKSGGFLGGLIKLLVVLGLLGGAGYAVWKNKEELTELASNLMPSIDVEQESTTGTENAKPANEAQEETLTSEVVKPEPVKPEVKEPEIIVPEVVKPEVTEPEVTEPEVVEPAVTEPAVAEPAVVVEPEVVQPVPEAETTQEDVQPTTQQSGVIPIGEVAYLYEEGSAGSGATRTNAAIIWEAKQESLKEGLAPEPVIVGKMDVPEKAITIDIEIKRNIDEAVSASHLIEIRFSTPTDFPGKSVESIARFVMKASEEAAGEPLVAVPVKVSAGFFLIALDNLVQAVAVNTQLLKESSWIDIPVVYGTGKRALITLEKGGTGERVFDEALKDWQNR